MRRPWGLERQAAEGLERGHRDPLSRALGAAWAWAARRRQRAGVFAGAYVIGVEGATLGGSWKTPVSVSLASELARRGHAVALLSHGYGASAGVVRQVSPQDEPWQVGDEALLAARLLGSSGVVVVVGPRAQALRELAPRCGVVVADGASVRAGPGAASLLSLDASAPWGAGACPPSGDLRAPVDHLLSHASHVVAVSTESPASEARGGPAWWEATATLRGLERVRGGRVAVVTAVARPGRFLGALERGGVRPVACVRLPDHAGRGALAEVEARLRGEVFEAVVSTEKCALWLGARVLGRPVVALGVEVRLPGGLVGALERGMSARDRA